MVFKARCIGSHTLRVSTGASRWLSALPGTVLRIVFIVICTTIFAVLFSGCEKESRYTLRVDSIRAVDRDADPVDLSIWIYDPSGNLVSKSFDSRELDPGKIGTEWLSIRNTEPIRIPEAMISEDGVLQGTIKLNPNRLATPPDAIFPISINLAEAFESEVDPIVVTLQSRSDAPYELRVELASAGG